MGTLGTYLREAREARGLDLRDAAQQTRISVSYLAAIEAEEFAKLPGEVFVKGFLKNYARFLGLPEAEVMKRYAELRSPAAPQAAPAAPQKEEPAKPHHPAPQPVHRAAAETAERNVEPFIWGGIIFVALIAFIFIARPARHPAPEQGGTASSTPTGTLATGPTTTGFPDKIYLDIEALEDTWVLVRTDSSPQKHAVLKKGESVTWSADERFLLSYGSAGAVRLLLNGRELEVAGPRNAVIRDLIVTAKGVEQPKTEAEKPRRPKPPVTASPTATAPAATAPAPQAPAVPAPVAPTDPAPRSPSMPVPHVPEG